jgi:hypothetical protein
MPAGGAFGADMRCSVRPSDASWVASADVSGIEGAILASVASSAVGWFRTDSASALGADGVLDSGTGVALIEEFLFSSVP